MSKRFGMLDIFQATPGLIVFVSVGGEKHLQIFSFLNLPNHFFKESSRAAFSTQFPKELILRAPGGRLGLARQQWLPKLSGHKDKKAT